MNRFIGLIIMVVAIAALAGAAIGWRFPFLGRSQSSNQLQTAQRRTVVQPANRRLGARQTTTTAQAPNTTPRRTAQAPTTTTNPDATNPPSPPQNASQPVSALW